MKWRLLLVCTGNTCRSPMARVLAEDLLAERYGVSREALAGLGIVVDSAGLSAMEGQPASPEAVQVMGRYGLDLKSHRSRLFTVELAAGADLILGLTRSHTQMVRRMLPDRVDRIHPLLADDDVADPIGYGLQAYEYTAKSIEAGLRARIDQFAPAAK